MKYGIYLHIPFCRKKCDYCGFYSIPVGHLEKPEKEDLLNRYIDKLCCEIRERCSLLPDSSFDTVYFGGGTPSLLSPEMIERVIKTLFDNFSRDTGHIEITVECNPEDFSVSRIDAYKTAGVNRIILGMQTLNPESHKIIGRSAMICDENMINDFFKICGITHCVDIIAGIPGEKRASLAAEIKKIIEYRPEHVSAYILSIEKDTPLGGRLNYSEVMERKQRKTLEQIISLLTDNGYNHYEVSNFAIPGYESRHNLKYWRFMPYAGFGAGAHSFINRERYINKQSVDEYLNCQFRLEHDARSRNSEIAEYIMTGMRLRDGISLNDFQKVFGVSMPADLLERFKNLDGKNLVNIYNKNDDIYIQFTMRGMYIMDALVFDIVEDYL